MVSHFYRALGIVILGILEQTMSGVLTISIELEQSENSFYLLFLIVHFFRGKAFQHVSHIFFLPQMHVICVGKSYYTHWFLLVL